MSIITRVKRMIFGTFKEAKKSGNIALLVIEQRVLRELLLEVIA